MSEIRETSEAQAVARLKFAVGEARRAGRTEALRVAEARLAQARLASARRWESARARFGWAGVVTA